MKIKVLGNKNNPVIVMIHGFISRKNSIRPVAEKLKENFYVIMPSLDGFYEGSKDYTSAGKQARILNIALHRMGIDRIAMLHGSSIGANVAMSFAGITDIMIDNYFFDSFEFYTYPRPARYFMYQKLKKDISYNENSYPFMSCKTMKNASDTIYNFSLPDFEDGISMNFFFNFSENEPAHKCREKLMKKYPFALYSDYPSAIPCGFMLLEPEVYSEFIKQMILNTDK